MAFQKMVKYIKKKHNNFKILFMGLDNAGKTTILNTLFNLRGDCAPTYGYKIHSVVYEKLNNKEVKGVQYEKVNNKEVKGIQYEKLNNKEVKDTFLSNPLIDTFLSNPLIKVSLTILDIGGQECFKSYWNNYFESIDGIVFIVDCTDSRNFCFYLNDLLKLKVPICIMLNKIDINPKLKGDSEILANINNVMCFPTCAYKIEGLRMGMDWLLDKIM